MKSDKYPRYWLALHPDVDRPIGGVKQMHRLCEAISLNNRSASLIQDDASFHPGWFNSDVETISRKDWLNLSDLSSSTDVVILPETFLNVYELYAPGIPKIIFNQNGSYTFGTSGSSLWPNPQTVLRLYHHADLLHVLCVSCHDEILLHQGLCIDTDSVSRLVNPIEIDMFHGGECKLKQIAFMPRKNTRDSLIVSSMLAMQPWWADWKLVPIQQKSQKQVAEILMASSAFLAFGHPEGFGLPLAEALASECLLIGYSGLGGRELFDLGATFGTAREVSFGDWYGFVDAVKAMDKSINSQYSEIQIALSKCSRLVRKRYSQAAFQESVNTALLRWENAWRKRFVSPV
ncbi:hypothetical protein N9S87_00445 [Synechococcus sp. AH-779-G23]|nr:hypothetical protein [Synechococcus sp. AH-779-G23]MDA9638934.1 hypothetical protein [Synechococcus sp. AH-779-G23]